MRRFLVRSAGFPPELVDWPHADLDSALTELIRAETAITAARAAFDKTIPATVGKAPAGPDRQAAARALYQWRRAVKRERPVDPALATTPAAARWASLWNSALLARADAGHRVGEAAATDWVRSGDRLRMLAGEPAFRTAVLTSNPDAYQHAVLPASRGEGGDRSLRTVYAYAQRFAMKNETTSFFGPIDYGLLTDRRPAGGATGPAGPPPRRTCLAHWAAQTIADHALGDPEIRRHVPLRLRSGLSLSAEGRLLNAVSGTSRALSTDSRDALASAARGRPPGPHAETLVARGVLVPDLTVPTAVDDPGDWLDAALAGLVRQGARPAADWRGRLARLRQDVDLLGAADADERLARLRALEHDFTAFTGRPPRRRAGDSYADRLLFTEHRRSRTGLLSVAGATALAHRLAPLLGLCASYSLSLQRAVTARALEVHDRLADGKPVPFLRFAARLDGQVDLAAVPATPEVAAWLATLDDAVMARDQTRECRLDAEDVGPLLERLPPGMVVSPDLFVVPRDGGQVTDVADADIVVGEVHHGTQTWTSLSVLDPDRDATGREVSAALGADDPEFASLLFARTQGKSFERELPAGAVAEFRGRSTRPASRVIPAESLTVTRDGEELTLRDRTGRPIRLRPRHPRSPGNWLFGLPPVVAPPVLRAAGQCPRIVVGDVVAWRRRWTLDDGALTALRAARTPGELVKAAAALTAVHRLSRRVFVRTAPGVKPVFADLRCPRSLDHLAHRMRGAGAVTVTEMLPDPGGWWLERDGRRHGCEWRMTLHTRPVS